MRLILVRHGKTEENKAGIIQGHLPGKLISKGISQAKKLALRLKNENIDFIYSSDLDRAINTTKEIIKFHQDVPVKYVKDLREKYLGEWQGKTKLQLGFKNTKEIYNYFPKDGETSEELYKRAKNILKKFLSKHLNETILISAHNGIIKAIIAVITGKNPSDIRNIEKTHNTSVSIFEIDKDKDYKMNLFNCAKHLDD